MTEYQDEPSTMATTTTNVKVLAICLAPNHEDDDPRPMRLRCLVDDKYIKYVVAEPFAYPRSGHFELEDSDDSNLLIDEGIAVELPEFPLGDWNVGRINEDRGDGMPWFSQVQTLPLAELRDAWHPTRIDYLELTTFERFVPPPRWYLPKTSSERLCRVTHPMFPEPVLMRIADFPFQLPRLEAESRAYRALEGSAGIAPRFLGHVTEGGRVVGFLLEWIAGADGAGPDTLDACVDTLERLHGLGIIHGNTRPEHFLCRSSRSSSSSREDGRALVIDFGRSKLTVDQYRSDHESRDIRHLEKSVSASAAAAAAAAEDDDNDDMMEYDDQDSVVDESDNEDESYWHYVANEGPEFSWDDYIV